MATLRMPITTASRKGFSAVISAAADRRVVLTNHGRPAAVVDAAERLDEDVRKMREGSAAVLDAAADLVSQRGRTFNLDEVCARVGVDPARVRERAGAHFMQHT